MANIYTKDSKLANILIDQVFGVIVGVANKVAATLPEPTLDNVDEPNTRFLIELRDWFLAHETNDGRRPFWRMLFNGAIIKLGDAYYAHRANQIVKKLKEYDWEFRGKDTGHPYWRDNID